MAALASPARQPRFDRSSWFTLAIASGIVGLTLGVVAAVHAAPVVRMQTRWVALGGLVGLIGPICLWIVTGGMSPQTPYSQSLLYLLLALALPISLAIAILRYRLWGIQVIIRRTLVYGLVSGALALVYYASVVTLQPLFRAMPGQPQSELVTVVSTLATVALFFPLRSRVQRVVDRRFYRRKYDAPRTLAAFGTTCRDQTDLEHLASRLVGVVDETMQPAHLTLWLRPLARPADPLAGAWRGNDAAQTRVALAASGEAIDAGY